MLSFLLLLQSYTWSPEIEKKENWKQFQDWEVFFHQGEFDTEPVVIIRTLVNLDQANRNGRTVQRTFGFRIFGKNYYQYETGIEGEGAWPHCDYELSKYAVDGQPASFFPTAGGGGVCEHVTNGRWVTQFKGGGKVRLQVNGESATASLSGFGQAWSLALQKAR